MVFVVALSELFGNLECDFFINYSFQGSIRCQQSFDPLYSVQEVIKMRKRKNWALLASPHGTYSFSFLSSLFIFIANDSRENVLPFS